MTDTTAATHCLDSAPQRPDLGNLSRIGFGSYRISRGFREHYDALRRAMELGCNLIDTAATYSGGDAERLVGEVLANRRSTIPFVVSKAGYVQGESAVLLETLNRQGRGRQDIVRTADGSIHSIHPEFLAAQIQLSLTRLGRPFLDGFLLHNPEYYFEQADVRPSREEYGRRIRLAFEFLEEQVARGLIRYYGVSSNSLAVRPDLLYATRLEELLAFARHAAANNHFRLIQFPMNLVEDEARQPYHGGQSLLQLAGQHGLTTFVNRALNANSPNGSIRLATYEEDIVSLDHERDGRVAEECLNVLRARFRELEIEDDVTTFAPVQVIAHCWDQFGNTDIAEQFLELRLRPFLSRLWEEGDDQTELRPFAELRRILFLYAKRNMHQAATVFQRSLVAAGKLAVSDPRSLAVAACEFCLNSGANHVLVGMRNVRYVESLQTLIGDVQ